MIMQLLNVKIGMTFSGGLLDFILLGVIPNRTRWWLVILVGLGFAVVYYFLFRFFIRKFDLKTQVEKMMIYLMIWIMKL